MPLTEEKWKEKKINKGKKFKYEEKIKIGKKTEEKENRKYRKI